MTNPISNEPGNTPVNNVNENANSPGTNTTSLPEDTLETSTTPRRVALKDYYANVSIPTLENVQQKREDEFSVSRDSSAFYTYIALEMGPYQEILHDINLYNRELGPLQDLLDNLNDIIDTSFNPTILAEDQAQFDALNQAIDDYNAALQNYEDVINNPGSTPAEIAAAEAALNDAAIAYNAAAADYQTYMDQRNLDIDAYNTAAAAYNDALANFSIDPESIGLGPLPSETLPLTPYPDAPGQVPTSPPVPTSPLTPVDDTLQAPPPINANLQSGSSLFPPFIGNPEGFSQIYGILLALQGLFNENRTRPSLRRLLEELVLKSSDFPNIPEAFVDNAVNIQLSAKTSKAPSGGSSVNSSLFPFNLAQPSLAGAIAAAIALQERKTDTDFLPAQVGDKTTVLISQTLNFNSTAAIVPVLNSLNSATVSPTAVTQTGAFQDASIKLLLAFFTAQNLLREVENNALLEPITTIVNDSIEGDDLTEEQINQLIEITLTTANASLLTTALNLISSTIQVNDLPQDIFLQVLEELNVPAAEAALIASRQNISLNDVLTNPTNITLLQAALLQRTNELGLPTEQATQSIAESVGTILESAPFTTPAELRETALNSFQNQAFSPPIARVLANDFTQSVSREIEAPNLNDPFPVENFSVDLLRQELQTDDSERNAAVNTALNAALERSPATIRGFRETFTIAQQGSGLDLTTAQANAQKAVLNINQQINPILPFTPQNVQQDILQASLVNNLVQVLPLSPIDARPVADRAINTALNATPPPATPEELRSGLATGLTQQGVVPNRANEAAANTFITTQPAAAPTRGELRVNINNRISNALERISGGRDDQLADRLTDLLLKEDNSIRDQLRQNLEDLNRKLPRTDDESLSPVISRPVHEQIMDNLYKKQIVFDSIDAPAIITSVFKGKANFGVPKEPIEFPQDLKG